MIIRTIRDIFTGEVDTIYIDEPAAYERAKEFLQIVMPRYVEPACSSTRAASRCSTSTTSRAKSPRSISAKCRSSKAARSSSIRPRPWWPSTSTAATSAPTTSAEETAYQMNQLAAKEIARQLRLRDLGGVIVNDFIDMRKERHRRSVERALRDAMKRDRARTKILRTSPFGLIEMTRQRIRPSLKRSVYKECPCCSARAW